MEPITADYKGYTVCEIPPNGHGITVLMALNILKGLPLSQERDSADTYHKILEAIKLAFADTRTYVADPGTCGPGWPTCSRRTMLPGGGP